MSFRLRFRDTDIELPVGEFVVGRSASCNLSLDDALVSRRHACFRSEDGRVEVEDLGSRNGVMVNGSRIARPTTLAHLDRVSIGSQEVLLLGGGRHVGKPTLKMDRCASCGGLVDPAAETCPTCGAEHAKGPDTVDEIIEPPNAPRSAGRGDPAVAFGNRYPIAEKALALGRHPEAARLLEPALERLREDAAVGRAMDADLLEQVASVALRIAEGHDASRWIHYAVGLHGAAQRVPSEAILERLHELVRRTRFGDADVVREALESLRELKLDAGARLRLKRLEALERVIAA
ncbi:MAG: FHA domain-containing protein [Myxococcota bacterium]